LRRTLSSVGVAVELAARASAVAGGVGSSVTAPEHADNTAARHTIHHRFTVMSEESPAVRIYSLGR
jgi:hypothetical protein